jgi:hypothetical protein
MAAENIDEDFIGSGSILVGSGVRKPWRSAPSQRQTETTIHTMPNKAATSTITNVENRRDTGDCVSRHLRHRISHRGS